MDQKLPITFNVFSLITAIGAFIILLFIIVLLTRKKHFKSNMLFSLFLVAVLFSILNVGILCDTNIIYYIPHMLQIPYIALLLMGPMFYLYIKTLLAPNYRFTRRTILHFVPVIVYFALRHDFYLQSGDQKLVIIRQLLGKDPVSGNDYWTSMLYITLVMLHVASYSVYFLFYFCRYYQSYKQNFSTVDPPFSFILLALRLLLINIIINTVAVAVIFLLDIHFKYYYPYVAPSVTIGLVILLFYVAFKADINEYIIHNEMLQRKPVSELSFNDYNKVLNDLMISMEKNQLFMLPEISLPSLASQIGVTRNQLSYILNKHFNETFYDFINRYRIEEAKKILSSVGTNNLSILEIGFMVGYKNKSTFNSNFKKIARTSPKEYRKLVKPH